MTRIPTAAAEGLVICSDGSTWRGGVNGWTECPPIPGSERDAALLAAAERERVREAKRTGRIGPAGDNRGIRGKPL